MKKYEASRNVRGVGGREAGVVWTSATGQRQGDWEFGTVISATGSRTTYAIDVMIHDFIKSIPRNGPSSYL